MIVTADDRARALGWRLLDRAGVNDLPEPVALIDGLLPQSGIAALVGSRGLGKSLLALSIAATVATEGQHWCGLAVKHSGPVLYVAMEGFHGVSERLRAWEQSTGSIAEQVIWLRDDVDLRRDAHVLAMADIAKDLGVVAVILDSARATGAGAEDTRDMGRYVRGLETIQRAFKGLVMVLHNTGWNAARERGSTLLPDACDTVLLLQGEPDGVRTLSHRKHRDGPFLEPELAFTFEPTPGTSSGVLVQVGVQDDVDQRLLRAVADQPGSGSAQIAMLAGVGRTTASSKLTRLEEQGLVRNTGTRQRAAWSLADH